MSTPLRSCLVAALACTFTLACDEKKADEKPASSASASASAAPVATTPPAPPRPPIVSLDDSAITVQGDRIDFTGDAKGKLTALLAGNSAVPGARLELQAARDSKTPKVELAIAAIKASKATGVTIKTATRELSTLGQLDLTFDHAPPAACSVVGMVGKDSSILVWPYGGGTAQRFTHGMAGPDLTLGSDGMRKASAACESPVFFVGGDDAVKWGLVFDLALAASGGEAGTMRATRLLVLTEAPVAGRKVTE